LTASLCFLVFVYPCCLKAGYKSKLKSKIVFNICELKTALYSTEYSMYNTGFKKIKMKYLFFNFWKVNINIFNIQNSLQIKLLTITSFSVEKSNWSVKGLKGSDTILYNCRVTWRYVYSFNFHPRGLIWKPTKIVMLSLWEYGI